MDLKTLILPSKEVEFEYEGVKNLFFTLSYISKSELERMRKAHTKLVRNKHTKMFEEELNQEDFLKEYIPEVLKGWKGLTLDTIQHFLLVDGEEDPEQKVEYTDDNAYTLLTNSSDLDNWVSDMIGDIENFRMGKSKKQ